jgi:hypothetical protein
MVRPQPQEQALWRKIFKTEAFCFTLRPLKSTPGSVVAVFQSWARSMPAIKKKEDAKILTRRDRKAMTFIVTGLRRRQNRPHLRSCANV